MVKLYLLQSYKEYSNGQIIEVSKEISDELIAEGIARLTTNRDFLVKPEWRKAKAKAFGIAPNSK